MPAGELVGVGTAVLGPDELCRLGEGRIGRVDLDLGDEAQDRSGHTRVAERLREPVADHALGLRAQHVERVRVRQRPVVGAFERKHPDLGSVAVTDEQIVVLGERREGVRGRPDVAELDAGVGLFVAFEERVAAERDDDAHVSRPARRQGPRRSRLTAAFHGQLSRRSR